MKIFTDGSVQLYSWLEIEGKIRPSRCRKGVLVKYPNAVVDNLSVA